MTAPATAAAPPRRPLAPAVRRTIVTTHIVASVGLLGDTAAVLAVNVRAATTGDDALARSAYELLEMFTVIFGIPLSFLALGTGLLLGVGTKWGVLRHGWVVAKLAVIVTVILVGALVLGPGTQAMQDGGGGREARLIAGSAYDVVALTLATALSVFKPRFARIRGFASKTAKPVRRPHETTAADEPISRVPARREEESCA